MSKKKENSTGMKSRKWKDFGYLLILFFFLLMAVLPTHWIALDGKDAVLRLNAPIVVPILAILTLLFSGAAYWLRRHPDWPSHNRKRWLRGGITILLSAAAVVCAIWLGEKAHEVLNHCFTAGRCPLLARIPANATMWQIFRLFVFVVVMVVGVVVAERLSSRIRRVYTLKEEQGTPIGKKVLIAPVSQDNYTKKTNSQERLKAYLAGEKSDLSDIVVDKGGCLSDSLTDDLEKNRESRWNWWQLLRGIAAHSQELKHIVLIGSIGDDGSYVQLETAAKLLIHYKKSFANHETLKIWIYPGSRTIDMKHGKCEGIPTEGIKFEDLDLLQEQVRSILTDFERMKCSLSDMVIDATGGLKTTSIAMALVSLHYEELAFQYTETFGGKGKIRPYNTIIVDKPRLGD